MFIDNKKLLNTILHSKVINSQLEVEFVLSCMDSCQSSSQPLEAINRKYHRNRNNQEDEDDQKDTDGHEDKEGSSPIVPKILQYTQLEESNFKTHFFITRSSFQVIYLFHVSQMDTLSLCQKHINCVVYIS